MANPVTAALRQSGSLFALVLDTLRAMPRRPFQAKEFIQQCWFIASVTIVPTALVSIPFGAVIALQLGTLTRQHRGGPGEGLSAELGSRKIREEIDAMEVLGISPIHRLVVPRVLA